MREKKKRRKKKKGITVNNEDGKDEFSVSF